MIMPVLVPEQLTLGEVVTRLDAEDPVWPVPAGSGAPHSYRGDHSEVAFGIEEDVTVGSMPHAARPTPGVTFDVRDGGEHIMHDYDCSWLVQAEGDYGKALGAVLLDLMLRKASG